MNSDDFSMNSHFYDDRDVTEWGLVHDPEFSVHNFVATRTDCSEPGSPPKDMVGVERVVPVGTPRNYHTSASADCLNQSRFYCDLNQPGLNSYANRDHYSLPNETAIPNYESNHAQDDSELAQNEKLTTSVKSMWNNFKNGFTIQFKTDFKYDSVIWLLGSFYHCSKDEREEQRQAHSRGKAFMTNMDAFKLDFASRIWFTYRKGFDPLPQSTLTSDVGWGCMLRSGQMMLAQALVLHLLNRGWRYQIRKNQEEETYRRIIALFGDVPSRDCPFSLHKLVEIGIEQGKQPGDWFGPASVAYVLSKALTEGQQEHAILRNICIYVAQDCTVYLQDIVDMCTQEVGSGLKENDSVPVASRSEECPRNIEPYLLFTKPLDNSPPKLNCVRPESKQNNGYEFPTDHSSRQSANGKLEASGVNRNSDFEFVGAIGHESTEDVTVLNTANGDSQSQKPWRSLVVFIPVRLGGIELNEGYILCLKNLLAHHMCLGIIGGKPRHSLYFIGWQEDKTIYLDPHFCQDMIDPRSPNASLESFHCNSARKINFAKLDPSCTIGFYCKTREDFTTFVKDAKNMCAPITDKQPYPMFVFQDGRYVSPEFSECMIPRRDRLLKVRHYDREGRAKPAKGSDDFVFLDS